MINQPLSDLALEIITEAMGNYEYAFTGRFGDAPLARKAMAARCAAPSKNGKYAPRHLRAARPRAVHAARFAEDGGDDVRAIGRVGDAGIALCLDHSEQGGDGKPLPAVTREVYSLATRLSEEARGARRVAAELRRIIGEPVKAIDGIERRLAA